MATIFYGGSADQGAGLQGPDPPAHPPEVVRPGALPVLAAGAPALSATGLRAAADCLPVQTNPSGGREPGCPWAVLVAAGAAEQELGGLGCLCGDVPAVAGAGLADPGCPEGDGCWAGGWVAGAPVLQPGLPVDWALGLEGGGGG